MTQHKSNFQPPQDVFIFPEFAQNQSSFLSLPSEIRTQILELLLSSGKQGLRPWQYDTQRCAPCVSIYDSRAAKEIETKVPTFGFAPALLATCQQLHAEGLWILYEKSPLVIEVGMSRYNPQISTFDTKTHQCGKIVSDMIPTTLWKRWRYFEIIIRIMRTDSLFDDPETQVPISKENIDFLIHLLQDLSTSLPKHADLTLTFTSGKDVGEIDKQPLMDRAVPFTKLLRCQNVKITGIPQAQISEYEEIIMSDEPVYDLHSAATSIEAFLQKADKHLAGSVMTGAPSTSWDSTTHRNIEKMWDAVWAWDVEGFAACRSGLLKRVQHALCRLTFHVDQAFGHQKSQWDEVDFHPKKERHDVLLDEEFEGLSNPFDMTELDINNT